MATLRRTQAGRALVGALALTACALLTLMFAPRAGAEPIASIGPINVQNGLATVSGSVADPTSTASVTVNGTPLGVNASGQFSGTINLNGESVLTFTTTNPATGETATTRIPLTTNVLGQGGTIPSTVLDTLRDAGINLNVPPDGFTLLDGVLPKVGGTILNKDGLSSLTVNGAEVLGLVGPDGSFLVPASGSSKEVVITSTDRQGVSQTSAFPVRDMSSVIQTAAGRSVAAAGALGLKIAKVRYITKGIKKSKRLRMIVTVKDKRGFLVRDAIVTIRSVGNRLKAGQKNKLTSRTGTATFVLKPKAKAFAKRLVISTTARTPTAKAQKKTSVRLPRIARAAR